MLKYVIDFVSEDVDLWRFPDDKLWIVRKETVLKACDPFHLLSHKKVFFSPLLLRLSSLHKFEVLLSPHSNISGIIRHYINTHEVQPKSYIRTSGFVQLERKLTSR